MSEYAGSGSSAVKVWSKKKGNHSLVSVATGLAQRYAVPAALVVYAVHRYFRHRKLQPKKQASSASANDNAHQQDASSAAHRRPRRDYKVNRDAMDKPVLATLGATAGETPEVQPHDNVVEAYHEDEVERAAAAGAAGGGGNTAMLQMLQQMGYKMVMKGDQVFLVPPGAAVPGEANEEGDEEGYEDDEEYDEDEEA